MKRNTILYWVFTILFSAFMIWSSIPGIKPDERTIQFLHDGLGFPIYFIQFISVAKVVGAIAILIPGLNRIKEWAYAGLFFDLVGAFYSINASAGKFEAGSTFILLPLLLGALSYYFWKRKTSV
jgi:uncharacterized membrane protein YphA (DoxX/SURF4 family)